MHAEMIKANKNCIIKVGCIVPLRILAKHTLPTTYYTHYRIID